MQMCKYLEVLFAGAENKKIQMVSFFLRKL